MESLAYSVLEKYREQLVASNVDPFRLSYKLGLQEVIADADVKRAFDTSVSASERWRDLVSAIMKNSAEGVFHKFIDALLGEKELEYLGQKMKETYILDEEGWTKEPQQAPGASKAHFQIQDEKMKMLDTTTNSASKEPCSLKLKSKAGNTTKPVLVGGASNAVSTALSPRNTPDGLHCIGSRKEECEEFLSLLGLKAYYPQKLTLRHALEIREDTLETVHISAPCTDPKLYPSLILQKIMAFDYTCRKELVLSPQQCSNAQTKMLLRCGENESELEIHPMDGLLAVLHCADNFLRQDLIMRLVTCQLAVPLLLPDPIQPHKVTFPIWAMRSIVKEWHTSNSVSKEAQLVSYPSPFVSFLRIGKFKVSKSRIVSYTISKSKHDMFFHYDCDGGSARHFLVNGLVEMCWYFPSKQDKTFSDLTTFANLHGDAREFPKQVNFLSKVSFMNFVFISASSHNGETLDVLKNLASAPGGLILLQTEPSDMYESNHGRWQEWLEPIKKLVKVINLKDKNDAKICVAIQKEINRKLSEIWNDVQEHCSLEKCSDTAHLCDILVDEDEEDCQVGKKLALAFEKDMNIFQETHGTESLKQSLPLQGPDLWKRWALTEKELYRQTQRGKCEVDVYSQQQRQKMDEIRKKQYTQTQDLQPLMKSFLSSLLRHKKTVRHYFLQWIRLFLDNLSRKQLSQLHVKYKQKVSELEDIQERKDEAAESECVTEMQKLNLQLISASFGLEHLLREVSQLYEAVVAHKPESVSRNILSLPGMAAELMIEGYPLELMDGDAAHMPSLWVSAVLSKVQEKLDNPRLFVLSVLGIQSSGKSTLMNTMFGVRFSTSAGRCTRGAFMQLLPVHSNLRQAWKCDYFLIVDTEGLRAPELGEHTHKHDNELATFVVGLANITIINLSGEVLGDVDDILQTTVHAFLRMKTVELKRSCHFVHQNVTAVKAGEKTIMDHMMLKKALDTKTQAAAKEEGLEDKYKHYTDVISFDSKKHVFHFQNLWQGDPPMAPVNLGYSTNAQFLKLCLIAHVKQTSLTHFDIFLNHLNALWKAILHENFVFSFRNILEIVAYTTLDSTYSKWSWEFKRKMMTWEQKASNKMKSCNMSRLSSVHDECCSKLPKDVENIHQSLEEKLNVFFENNAQREIIVKWKGETRARLTNLARQLKEHAENHCRLLKANRDTFAKVDEMKEEYTAVILDNVKQVASQLTKGKLNDEELEKRFDKQWTECIDKMESVVVYKEEVSVKTDVQSCLTGFEPLRPSLPKVLKKLDLHLDVTNVHVVYSRLRLIVWSSELPIRAGQEITNKVLEHQKKYLQEMYYHPDIATELLHKLFNDITRYSADVTFTEEYRVDMALTVCRYAIIKLQEMVDTERKHNDPVATKFQKMVRQEVCDIKSEVEKSLLCFHPLQPALEMVNKKLKDHPLSPTLHLKVKAVHVKEVQIHSETAIAVGQDFTNRLLEQQRMYLQQMKENHYNPNLATELLHKLFNEISSHGVGITFTDDYRVDMALTVCGYAVIIFQKMVDIEKERSDPVLYLERKMRGPLLQIFKDEYNQIAREVTAASTVCDLLLQSMRKEVINSLSPKIAESMRDTCDFLQNKPALKAQILVDIGDGLCERSKGAFAKCLFHLEDAKESLCSWLEHYSIKHCEVKLVEIATKEMSRSVRLIEQIVGNVFAEVLEAKSDFKITDWLTAFHTEVQKSGSLNLDMTELHQLGGVHQVKDASHFKREILNGLKTLESTLKGEFDNMPVTEMKNGKKMPHEHLLEELAGCTEQCPFCKEQCDLTNPKHPSKKHRVSMHRPRCLGRHSYAVTEEMVLETCSAAVASSCEFQNQDTGKNFHPYREYAKLYPRWFITADISFEESIFWKWLIGNYSNELADLLNMKVTKIPSEWEELQWDNVKKILKDKYNV